MSEEILNIIRAHGPITSKEIAARLYPDRAIDRSSSEWRQVRRKLEALAEDGTIIEMLKGFVVSTAGAASKTPPTPTAIEEVDIDATEQAVDHRRLLKETEELSERIAWARSQAEILPRQEQITRTVDILLEHAQQEDWEGAAVELMTGLLREHLANDASAIGAEFEKRLRIARGRLDEARQRAGRAAGI